MQNGLHRVKTQVAQHALDREDAQSRLKNHIAAAAAELSSELEEEKAERLARAEVTQQMVQAVSSWLKAQE